MTHQKKKKEVSSSTSKSLFDLMGDITFKKTPWEEQTDEDKKNFSVFMINRFLSMNMEYTEIINYFQQYTIGFLSTEMTYKLYLSMLPKKRTYSKYIKGEDSKNEKTDDDLFKLMFKDFWWSRKEFNSNIKRINPIYLQNYLTDYGYGTKEIAKITGISIAE